MRISYALLLCVPIGVLLYWIARFCLRYLMGHYEQPERRAALIWGFFGALLIPTVWVNGGLQEEFPTIPGFVITYLLFLAEFLVIAGLIRRSYAGNRDKGREQKEWADF